MKKHTITTFLCVLSYALYAQNGYMAFGYNLNFFSSEQMDFVVDRYNETRTFLDNEMEYPHMMDGFTMRIGGGDAVFADLGFSWKGDEINAYGTDLSNNSFERNVKYTFSAWDLGVGLGLGERRLIGIGYCFTFGNEKIYNRVASPEEIDNTDYDVVSKTFMLGGNVFLQIIAPLDNNVAIIFRPYFQMNYFNNDFAPLNAVINPNTFQNDPDVLESKLKGFGFSACIGFGSF